MKIEKVKEYILREGLYTAVMFDFINPEDVMKEDPQLAELILDFKSAGDIILGNLGISLQDSMGRIEEEK